MSGLPHKAWVLVADGEKALFLRNVTDEADPFLQVIRKEEQENPKDIDQSANRPGRMSDGGPGQRSALDDTDWHELAKERFADDLAHLLYARAHRGAFDQIVLIAPPKTLGELRQVLHKEVAARVIAEVPKTLTNHPIDEIERQLRNGLIAA
ncbi:host attachment protein [Pseudooceanicola sediminis]|uniref:Host attachment protein n=1 Tax=Pseudooceanicola sediminis TaxID=2211117 RepID=A0A399IY46_9RHOB|nr:host attachment family protein [Pseudooceanicola sediminis]KAA2312712.1 host attachment protein [Puniceibacterium sp. HSS470]RII38005.1 host attachment protein [Pseudooceanicola sediminis]|tara:strand:+ start:33659 stop:34114 length:456 start_codon:yes stop_codon:yes gene_type:complete